MYTSTNDANINTPVISKQNNVCLNISSFMFSLLLSSIIELCNLIPLTDSAKMHGINIIVCNNNADIKNSNPFPKSKTKHYRRNGIT